MKVFLDTNVLVYWVDQHAYADRVEQLLQQDCVVSVQVLNEFANVLLRKRSQSLAEIEAMLRIVKNTCTVCDLTLSMHETALQLAKRYQFHVYDACIVAAAAQMRCTVLYSEDMQDGLSVQIPPALGGGSLSIKNPFV
jgi:predicted nucleic acid-binding protein